MSSDVHDREAVAGEYARENESRFHELADNISQFAWTADRAGWIYWYNKRWYDYTGTTLEEMQGWGWQKVHHPEHVDRVVQRIRQSFETGTPWEDTFPLRGRDGSYRWFLSRALPIRDEAGEVVRWFGTNTDITEQLEAEQALRDSEARFRELADNISQFAWTADRAGWIYWYNKRWYDYTGTTLEEMQGWGWQKVHHPEHVDRVVQRIRQSFETGTPWEDTFPLRGRDGSYRWFLSRALPIRDEAGEVVRWFGTNTDITEQIEAEEALRESEVRFHELADNINQFAWTADRSGSRYWYNKRWYDYTGTTFEEMQGWGWQKLHHPDHLDRVVQRMRQQFRNRHAVGGYIPSPGSRRPVSLVPVTCAADPQRRRRGDPLARDQYRHHAGRSRLRTHSASSMKIWSAVSRPRRVNVCESGTSHRTCWSSLIWKAST